MKCPMSRVLFPVAAAAFSTALLAAPEAAPVELTLTLGTGTVIDCPETITRVSASAPETVDAVTASRSEVLFHAKAVGKATMIIWTKSGARTAYNVTVEPNIEPMRKLLRDTFPDEDIDVVASRDSTALTGHASSQAVADRALALVAATVKGAVSNLQIAPAPQENQVLLRVRFAELNRTAVTELGVNLLSTGALNTVGQISTGQFPGAGLPGLPPAIPGGIAGSPAPFALGDILNIFAFRPDLNLGVIIRDLQSRGLLQILAEPNLVATSGKEASFLAGGEFPVPVVQGGAVAGAVTIQYREFGIRLSFTPQITPHHTIRLHVKPEVSSLDPADGVTISGFRVPGLTTRRVETDIELGERQSFVIGGLIDDRVVENLSEVPGLAHIPLLGALFKSRAETKSKTELIVIVTPETALPVTGPGPELQMPKPFLDPAVTEKKTKP
jgi:pilus assembly protein CpaC